MVKRSIAASMILACVAACAGRQRPASSTEVTADAAFLNGRIYTVDEAQPWVEAVAVKDGRFIAVGTDEEVVTVVGSTTQTVDLEGRFVMPGVLDLHTHPFITPWYGSMNLSLQQPGDADAILEEVRAYAEATPPRSGSSAVNGYSESSPTTTHTRLSWTRSCLIALWPCSTRPGTPCG